MNGKTQFVKIVVYTEKDHELPQPRLNQDCRGEIASSVLKVPFGDAEIKEALSQIKKELKELDPEITWETPDAAPPG